MDTDSGCVPKSYLRIGAGWWKKPVISDWRKSWCANRYWQLHQTDATKQTAWSTDFWTQLCKGPRCDLLFWLRDHLIAEDPANRSSNFLYRFPQKPLNHRHFTSAVHQQYISFDGSNWLPNSSQNLRYENHLAEAVFSDKNPYGTLTRDSQVWNHTENAKGWLIKVDWNNRSSRVFARWCNVYHDV